MVPVGGRAGAWGAAGLAALGGALLAGPAAATNVLLVVFDDLGADKVGAYRDTMYGSTELVYLPDTPTLDGLAEVGLRFADVYASPVCSPTRAGLFTGRYAFETDVGKTVTTTSPELSESETTLFELLRDPYWTPEPWGTAVFGKWHLGFSSPGGTDWDQPGRYRDTPNPGLHGVGEFVGELHGAPEDYYAWFEVQDVPVGATSHLGIVTASTTYAGLPAWEDAAAWIPTARAPWLAVVSATSPHADEEDSPVEFEEDDLPPGTACVDRDGDGACSSPEIYAELVTWADGQLGELLAGLAADDPALLEDLLVVVLGDNGSPEQVIEGPWLPTGERTGYGKNSPFESGIRVPLIVARGCDWRDAADGALDGAYADGGAACAGSTLPMRAPGLTVNARVQTHDLFATLLEVAGSSYVPPANSASLVPCLTASGADADDCGVAELGSRVMFTETFRRPWSEDSDWGTTGAADAGFAVVKQGPYKLVAQINEARACTRYGFFDLGTDPYETDDLTAGGSTLTATQRARYIGLKSHLTTTLALDWLPATLCSDGLRRPR